MHRQIEDPTKIETYLRSEIERLTQENLEADSASNRWAWSTFALILVTGIVLSALFGKFQRRKRKPRTRL